MFGLSKILDKICLCQIFNLLNVGALRHSEIFVNHKCQSHRNKHHHFARYSWERLHEISGVVGLLFVTVIFTALIECVASAYYLACEYSRLSFLSYCVSHVSMRGGCIHRLHNYCLNSRFFFFLELVQLQQKQNATSTMPVEASPFSTATFWY